MSNATEQVGSVEVEVEGFGRFVTVPRGDLHLGVARFAFKDLCNVSSLNLILMRDYMFFFLPATAWGC